jgi:hypothetical protein
MTDEDRRALRRMFHLPQEGEDERNLPQEISHMTDAISFVLAAAGVPQRFRSYVDAVIGASNGELEWFDGPDLLIGTRARTTELHKKKEKETDKEGRVRLPVSMSEPGSPALHRLSTMCHLSPKCPGNGSKTRQVRSRPPRTTVATVTPGQPVLNLLHLKRTLRGGQARRKVKQVRCLQNRKTVCTHYDKGG